MKAKMITLIFLTSMLTLIWSSSAWAAEAGYFDGYAFSAGVSDMGWQVAFSSGSRP